MIEEKELVWVARYKDGTTHTQYNAEGEHLDKYADIIRKELISFELWKPDLKTLVIRIHFDSPEKKLIWRKRVFKHSSGLVENVYLVGWQVKVEGKNVQSINVLFEDGHIEVIDKWAEKGNPLYALFGKPIVHPNEGEDWD